MFMHQTTRWCWRVGCSGLAAAALWLYGPVASAATVSYQVVTNEISAKQPGGGKVEVYRFDPAVYVAMQGDDVELHLHGLKGHDHPVVLEGYNVNGVIHRGQETVLKFKADKPGFYRLVCTAHADAAHVGPMEGYLLVFPRPASGSGA
ncbi:MAG: cupredoxin domain-containing protein [Alicyclobacillus sp.]|nr:cupredoxin domain-containing protein [Alicyclobacillus sp.]